jgi:F0F1-type ATP synthase assembly protein I
MKISQAKFFLAGAVLGAIFGALVLGPVVHFFLIGVLVAGVGAAVYRGRRIVLARTRAERRLKA